MVKIRASASGVFPFINLQSIHCSFFIPVIFTQMQFKINSGLLPLLQTTIIGKYKTFYLIREIFEYINYFLRIPPPAQHPHATHSQTLASVNLLKNP